ncbi:D-Ala-D-Ala carboxypeptidase family metallohydrolase [Tateyamaria armeniaca]|uniref:D-Ala-D-Ala carboxypeptidase family metallohydrolase n=1 Tax=Tateyamaria armeniaca TaxID=2518930 RepID=A0ABW8UNQ3_9RHOB
MATTEAQLVAKVKEIESKIQDIKDSTQLSLDEKKDRVKKLRFEIKKLNKARAGLAATEITAQAQKVADAAVAAANNVLQNVLQGIKDSAEDAIAAAELVLREITDEPAVVAAPIDPAPPAVVNPVSDDPVIMRRTQHHRVVYGHLVRDVQLALLAKGFDSKGADMFFGTDTEAALRAWRTATGRDGALAILTRNDWDELTGLPQPELFDLCAQATAAFEGHGFTQAAGDFDGAIATWGYHGYTLKYGHLQAVLERTEAASPGTLADVFGAQRAASIKDMLGKSRDDQIAWARANLLDSNKRMTVEWSRQFDDLGSRRACQMAQLAHSRAAFWETMAVPQAERLGLQEPLSFGMLFDAAIQQGGASETTLKAVEAARAAKPDMDEGALREVLAGKLTEQIKSDRFREDVKSRRFTFADGRGRVHGANYDLGYWGFFAAVDENETDIPHLADPPTKPAVALVAPDDFRGFFDQRIAPIAPNFSIEEFLSKGGAHGGTGPCGGLNTDPPRDKWENAIELARVLQAIRISFGTPVVITNMYRAPAYNTCIGGVSASQHMEFRAADIKISNGQKASQWHGRVVSMRNGGLFLGGIGRYQSFVHVDTRGSNASW